MYEGGVNRQFQWVNANGHPVLYTTSSSIAEQTDLRNCYERMQFVNGPPNGLPGQYLQQGQVAATGGANIAYMTAPMPVSSVNYTTTSSAGGGGELTYADLGVIGPGGLLGGGVPGKKMHYTTATLGRPPRHPELKRHEPTIYAQVSVVGHTLCGFSF